MTRRYKFARPQGHSLCRLGPEKTLQLPVFAGILKHLHPDELAGLLEDEEVARKYTRLALEKSAWQILKEFPDWWLLECLDQAELSEGRRDALLFKLQKGAARSPFSKEGS